MSKARSFPSFRGALKFTRPSLRAHYSSSETKLPNAVKHGAVGILKLDDPMYEQLYSFKEHVRDLAFAQNKWLKAR